MTRVVKFVCIILMTSSLSAAFNHRCRSSEFRCHSSSTCVSERRRCDNVYDCDDGSDEKNCGILRKIVTKSKSSIDTTLSLVDLYNSDSTHIFYDLTLNGVAQKRKSHW